MLFIMLVSYQNLMKLVIEMSECKISDDNILLHRRSTCFDRFGSVWINNNHGSKNVEIFLYI